MPTSAGSRRLILHIGLPKTGSSAIQEFLASNEKLLGEYGFGLDPGGRSEIEIAAAFSRAARGAAVGAGITSEADRHDVRERLRRRFAAAAGDLVISSEHLAGMLRTAAEVGDLADFLAGFFEQILVIGCIRRADYWIPSAYAEAVRSGRDVRQRAAFVERRAHLLDHDQLLQRWTAAFGTEAVRVMPFLERGVDDRPPIGLRFLAASGIPVDDHERWQVPAEPSRPSLSAIGVEVLRRIAPELEVGAMTATQRQRLVAVLAERHPGPRVALTPAAHRTLVEHGWTDTGIDRTPQAYGNDWARWRSTEPAPIRRPPNPDDALVDQSLAAVRAAGIKPGRRVVRARRQTRSDARNDHDPGQWSPNH